MSSKKSKRGFILIVIGHVLMLVFAACQKAQLENSIYGSWRTDSNSSDSHYFLFNEDGTWAVGYYFAGDESSPFDWGTFTLDGNLLVFSTAEDAESCPGLIGTYEVAFPNESDVIFTLVEEQCSHRLSDLGSNQYKRYSP
jgi:hypothetical protein